MNEQEMKDWGITEQDLEGIRKGLDTSYNEMMKDIVDDNPSYMN